MAELTANQRGALTAALADVRADVRSRLVAYASAMWDGLGDWRDSDLERFVAAVVPKVEAGKLTVATATDAALAAMIDAAPAGITDLAGIRHGVSAETVYGRPFVAMRSELSRGEDFAAALDAGRRRLQAAVVMDLELAHTHQARATMSEPMPGRRGRRRPRGRSNAFRRVPNGSETCLLCLVAATQRYWVGELLPIHPGCDCGVEPLGPGEHPDQVLDEALLESLHTQADALGGADRSAEGYRDLIVTQQHGEHGPSLRWRGQKFTTDPATTPAPAPEPERVEVVSKPREFPAIPDRLTGGIPEVDWLGSGLTAGDVADFPQEDLLELVSEALTVNDPKAYSLASAELNRRSRQDGYHGTGYTRDELRRQYADHVERAYWEAEAATNGQLLTAEARAAGVNPRDLFTGNETTAYKRASDDLKYWWDSNPRLTFEAFIGDADAIGRAGRAEF